jgi:N-methylhydantoinase B
MAQSPSNMTGTPIEVWENLTGMFMTGGVLLLDSGGPGQRIVLRIDSDSPITVACITGRTELRRRGVTSAGRAPCGTRN